MALLRFTTWHLGLASILIFGLPDRAVDLIRDPGIEKAGLLLVSSLIFGMWMILRPEE